MTFKFFKSHRILLHQAQAGSFSTYLADYASFANAFAVSNQKLSSDFCVYVLKRMYLTSAVLGWTVDEHDFAETSSKWSKYVHAGELI